MDKGSRSQGDSRLRPRAKSPKEENSLRPVGPFECTVHRRAPPAPQISEDLAVELLGIIFAALTGLDYSGAELDRAVARARELATPPRVSGPLLRDLRGLSEMLCAWSQESDYLDPAGTPKVLAISGPGATLERLAVRFLPGVALTEVLAMLSVHTQVARRPGDRMALVGGVLVTFAHSPQHVLAQGIRQIDQLLTTLLHNVATAKGQGGQGRIERMLLGVVTGAQFDELMQEFRPEIGTCLERISSAVRSRRPTMQDSLKDATTVTVGVYVARDDDWERAGVDAAAFVKGAVPEAERP